MRAWWPWLLVASIGCASPAPSPAPEPAQPSAPAEEPAPAEPPTSRPTQEPTSQPSADGYTASPSTTADDGSERFGAPLGDGEPLPLASLLAEPQDFAGKVVKVSGTVARVCRNQGCWVELRDADDRLRVPMAGHALAIPQRTIGRTATVEGPVRVRELTPEQKAHYASEGMTATDHAVSIAATSVLVMK